MTLPGNEGDKIDSSHLYHWVVLGLREVALPPAALDVKAEDAEGSHAGPRAHALVAEQVRTAGREEEKVGGGGEAGGGEG